MNSLFRITTILLFFSTLSLSAQQDIRFPLGDFNKIVVYDGIDLELTKNGINEAVFICEGIETDRVKVEISGGVLKLKASRPMFEKGIKIKAHVHYTELDEVKANNMSSVIFHNAVHGENFELTANTGSTIRVRTALKILDVKAQYNSSILVEGGVELLRAKSNTGSEIDARLLISQEALLEAHTGGIVKAEVAEKINANAGTGGQIFYTGKPSKETLSSSFGGSVIREN